MNAFGGCAVPLTQKGVLARIFLNIVKPNVTQIACLNEFRLMILILASESHPIAITLNQFSSSFEAQKVFEVTRKEARLDPYNVYSIRSQHLVSLFLTFVRQALEQRLSNRLQESICLH